MQFSSPPRASNHATSQMFMLFDTCFAFTLPIQQSTYRILWPEISLGALTQKEMPREKRTESASIICYLASGYDFMDFHISAPKRHNNPKDLVPDVREHSQITLTSFWTFLTTYPPALTFSTL